MNITREQLETITTTQTGDEASLRPGGRPMSVRDALAHAANQVDPRATTKKAMATAELVDRIQLTEGDLTLEPGEVDLLLKNSACLFLPNIFKDLAEILNPAEPLPEETDLSEITG